MNTITRLSGWSTSAAATASRSPSPNGGESPSRRRSTTAGQQEQQEWKQRNCSSSTDDSTPLLSSSLDTGGDASTPTDSELPARRSNVTNERRDGFAAEAARPRLAESPESVLKPPEAVLYEEAEAAMVATSLAARRSTQAGTASAAAYPSPPPTPPLPDQQRVAAASSASARIDEVIHSHATDGAEPQKACPGKTETVLSHAAAPSSGILALAQAYPIKSLTRLYMLIRRFLALFGIRVDDSESPKYLSHLPAVSGASDSLAGAPLRPSLDAPPSYADATASEGGSTTLTDTASEKEKEKDNGMRLSASATAAGPKRPRWRFPGLSVPMVGRKRRPSFPTTDSMSSSRIGEDEVEPGTSSDSSSVRAARTAGGARLSSSPDSESPIQQSTSGSSGFVPQERRSRRMSHATASGHRSKPSVSIAQRALSRPKLLVLDLDETLIHSTSRMGVSAGFNAVTSVGGDTSRLSTSGLKVRVVEVVLDGRSVVYHVYKRPWVDFFLRKVSAWYTVVIFTASMREYADPVIDWLDADGRGGMIATRLFRESCTYVNGSYVKDLRIVDPDLARVCLVDNSPISYAKDQSNGIPIEGWINDPNDEALLDLLPMLDSLRFTNDVRHVLGLRLATTSTVLPDTSGASAGNGAGMSKPRRQHRTSLTSLGPAELADLRSRR